MENIDTLLAAVAQTQGFEDEDPAAPEPLGSGENSEAPAVLVVRGGPEEAEAEAEPRPTVVEVPPKPRRAVEKKKRGRANGQLAAKPPASKRIKPEDEEEDVCFICFDGGSLVLCDCKGCPKAYHPACIKRDEAFFQSTAKWYCGWHICSVCRKASHYLCYTCSYSLCKGCAKDADYSFVRKNRGFCSICMKTIMLLENKGQANNESIQVDFDDKTSWEYLFKVYWVALKDKLSLTLDELTQAQKSWKDVGTIGCKPPSSNPIPNAVSLEVPISASSTELLGLSKPRVDIDVNNKDTSKPSMDEKEPDKPRPDSSSSSSSEWATKDLLEFVAHMKNGDTSPISQFDMQMLLLNYIKRYNLRDPHRKSQVICDQRLRNLFGKPRVPHFEMLKLLESHFLVKEESEKISCIPAGHVSSVVKSLMEVDGIPDGLPLPLNSRKRKTRKKSDEKAPNQNNLNEYAAIDVHNINLIYLQRSMMETLIEDHESFNNKVIGSIVRIIISSNDQAQNVHRLVQVVGTTKVDEPYKIGDMTTDVMLEVLNLDRREVVSIDAISNNEFTEDECLRLRQSIRCGLVKHFTVGEIQNKAMTLQPVRVDNCLEEEISRLNDVRDRASENGRKKEIRGIVSKLQRLKSPGERSRRISKILKIHTDPKMSPNYESEEDTKSGDKSKKDKEQKASRARNRVREKPGVRGSRSSDKHTNQVIKTNSVTGGGNNQPMRSPGLETSTATTSVGNSPSSSVIETEKLWHYRDPNGKTQGPFAMMQLRKWSTTGLFPPDMRIWTNHEHYDSLLLTDALNGKFNVALDSPHSKAQKEEEATEEIGLIGEVTNVSSGDSKPTEAGLGGNNNVSVSSKNHSGHVRADESGSWPQCWDLLKDNVNSNSDVNDVQACDMPPSLSPDKMHEDLPHHGPPQNGEKNPAVVTEVKLIIPSGTELQSQSYNEDCAGLPSEENLRSVNFHPNSNDTECESVRFAPGPDKPSGDLSLLDLSSPIPRTLEIDQSDVAMHSFEILELLSPTPKPNNEDQLATETKQSEFINFPVANSCPIWSHASSLVEASEVELPDVPDLWRGYSPTPAQPPMPSENVSNLTPNGPNWRVRINGIIELDAFGEDAVSELFDEAAAKQLQEASLPSPTSAVKFARELEECKDNDCFSSIGELSRKSDAFSSIGELSRKSDAFSSTGEIQLTSEQSVPCKPISYSTFDIPTRSSVHSSASSEGETINHAPVYSVEAGRSEFHPVPSAPNVALDVVGANAGPGLGSDNVDPGRGSTMVQGNINLVTVQGNVNLVLPQGMSGLGWETNQGAGWANQNLNPSPRNGIGSLPWDGQRMYGSERFSSPREWGGYQGGRPPWGRQPQYGGGGQQQYGGGGGYLRQIPKGQRVCKFYESGHCKKGAFCDYLHP